MDRPTVVLVGSWPPIPGISAYCVELARALAKIVHLKVLTFSHMYPDFLYPGGAVPSDGSFPNTHAELEVHRWLAWYHPLGWIRSGFRWKGSILHIQFWSLPLAPIYIVLMTIARWRGKRVVLTVHNLAGHERRGRYRWTLRRLIRRSHALIVHTERIPDWVRAECLGATEREPAVVPHGPLELFTAHDGSASEARERLGIPTSAKVILFFGAIRPYKGLEDLLEAFDEIAAKHPDAWLLIAGRLWGPWTPYSDKMEGKKWRDRVRLVLEYIPTGRVHWYFQAADLIALPYREFEAQSGVAMTAAAFGKPFLVTNVGGLPELVSDKRFVTPPANPRALAQALDLVMSDESIQRRLAEDARDLARKCSWEEAAQKTLRVYESVLVNP